MTIHVFSRTAAARDLFKGRSLPESRFLEPETLSACAPQPDDLVYLDTAGMDAASYKKQLRKLKTLCAGAFWGIIDSADLVDDPAELFQEGALDFIGRALLDREPSSARIKRVIDYARRSGSAECAAVPDEGPGERIFPGWSTIKPGEDHDFYFLYVSPENQGALKTRLGESGFTVLRDRLKNYIVQVLASAEALVWMQNEASLLLLVPVQEDRSRRIVEYCLRLLLNLSLVGYEQLGLEIPLPLVFALHRGHTLFQPPGNTGTVVSEDVNFIFHLGAKKAEARRLTLSAEAKKAIPSRLADLFVAAGSFEGKEILQSRLFI